MIRLGIGSVPSLIMLFLSTMLVGSQRFGNGLKLFGSDITTGPPSALRLHHNRHQWYHLLPSDKTNIFALVYVVSNPVHLLLLLELLLNYVKYSFKFIIRLFIH